MDEEKNVPPQLRDIDDADRHHNDRIKVSWEGGVDNLLKNLQDEETGDDGMKLLERYFNSFHSISIQSTTD